METKETSERKSCKLTVCCKECKFGGCTKRIKYYFDFWTSQTQLRSNRGENGECQQPLYFEADAWRAEDGLKTASSTATGATIFHREPLSRVLFLIVLNDEQKLCICVLTRFFFSFNLKLESLEHFFEHPLTVWPGPIWIKVKKSWLLLPQHQRGPESASIEIPPFRPKFT